MFIYQHFRNRDGLGTFLFFLFLRSGYVIALLISTVKRRVLIFCELIVNFFSCSNIPYFQNPLEQLEIIWHLLISLTLLVHNHDHTCIGFLQ